MALQISDVTIPIGRQSMGGYLAAPAGQARGTLLLIQEIFGVTPAMRAIADDFASEGFAVLVPDIYWRLSPDLDLGNGEEQTMRDLAVKYSTEYDEELGTQDLIAALAWLANAIPTSARPAVAGLCLGGRLALRVAAEADVSCMVSLYGVGLDKLEVGIASASCPLQFHFGDNDNHNPLRTIDAVRAAVAKRNDAQDEFFVYPTAEHAFYNRFRADRYNAAAQGLAKQRICAFLDRYATQNVRSI
jgi:carboxymethylenebutenolidase